MYQRTSVLLFLAALAITVPTTTAAQDSVAGVEGGGAATLEAFLARALDVHPTIREARARHEAALQRIPQATALPDPMVTFGQALRTAETRVGPQLNTLGVSQAFPWKGKRGLRGAVAEQEAEAAAALVHVREREVALRVRRAYYELAYVDEAARISREEQSLLELYERLAQSRYATGQGLQQAVLRLQAEITKLMNRLYGLEQQRSAQVARINALLDRSPDAVVPELPPLDMPVVELDIEALHRLGETHRQEVHAAEAMIGRGERAIALAERNRWPDLVVSAGFVNVGMRNDMAVPDNGKNVLTLSVGMNVPLWQDKYDAAVAQASHELIAQQANRDVMINDMHQSIGDLAARIETLRRQFDLFERVLLPQAREALRSSEDAYETGQIGVVDLLDSERTLLDVQLLHRRHAADTLQALADLERAIGTEVPGMEKLP